MKHNTKLLQSLISPSHHLSLSLSLSLSLALRLYHIVILETHTCLSRVSFNTVLYKEIGSRSLESGDPNIGSPRCGSPEFGVYIIAHNFVVLRPIGMKFSDDL